MKKIAQYKHYLFFILTIILVGQISFAATSKKYTTPHYESKIFFTTGIVFDGSDLHKLNEAAHYFGQTMIGWSKFPSFRNELVESVDLPEDTSINMHVQERQNMIFVVATDSAPIESEKLGAVKDFLQNKMNEYNQKTNTEFVMSNVDYQQLTIQKSYSFGAMMTLVLSAALGIALLFVKEMFFRS